jgi:hypothetical protein
MKLFDFKNPRHLKILKEELNRVKMLLEYNEADEWKRLTPMMRKVALMSADAEMGKDFAYEYKDEEWLNIPDTITNRIDLSKFILPKQVDPAALAQWIETNKSKLGSGVLYRGTAAHTTDRVIEFLRQGNPSQYYCAEVIASILKRGIMIDFTELEKNAAPSSSALSSYKSNINPYDTPSGRAGAGSFGSRNWTGD